MKIYVMHDANNRVIGWSSLPTTNGDVEIDINDNDPFLNSYPPCYTLVNGVLTKDNDYILNMSKKSKIEELKNQCNVVIAGGFTSSALGTTHTYPTDPTSMIYFNATYNRFNIDTTFASVDWQTLDAGYLTHTKDQFIQAFHDGHSFGITQEQHLKSKIADVNAATDIPTVQGITW